MSDPSRVFHTLRAAAARTKFPGAAGNGRVVEFLWQYIDCTPMAELARKATDEQRDALMREVSERWRPFVADGGMLVPVGMTTATARR